MHLMKHNPDQEAAARDMLADGMSRSDAARAIADQFGVSVRTGERVVASVSSDMSDTEPPSDTEGSVDYLAFALQAMAEAIQDARADGDSAAKAQRAEALAGMVAKTNRRWSV